MLDLVGNPDCKCCHANAQFISEDIPISQTDISRSILLKLIKLLCDTDRYN